MPQVTAKRAKHTRGLAQATADDLMRDVVTKLKKLAPLPPATVRSAIKGVLPQRKSSEIIHIAHLIVGLQRPSTRKASGTEIHAAKTATDLMAAQAHAAREALARGGDIVSSKDIRDNLGFTRQALSKAVREHRMFTVSIGRNRFFPAFYSDPMLDRRQLESVSKELGELPGWSKWQFFTTPKASLGGINPLDALKRGRFSDARRAAIGFLER